MAKSTWKSWELRLCRLFGGERRGADYGNRMGGKNDCKCTPNFSIETKKWKTPPPFRVVVEDVRKAEERKEQETDYGIAVFSLVGQKDLDAIVCIRLEEFLRLKEELEDARRERSQVHIWGLAGNALEEAAKGA